MLRNLIVAGILVSLGAQAPDARRNSQALATVHGTIYETGFGTVVEGARVILEKGSLQVPAAFSDKNGRYVIEEVPAGDFTVTVECAGFSRHASELTVDTRPIELNVGIEVGRIADYTTFNIRGGASTSDGTPLPGVAITVLAAFDKSVVLDTKTGSEGQYRITIPRAGQYVVYAAKPGFKPAVELVTSGGEESRADFRLIRFNFNRN